VLEADGLAPIHRAVMGDHTDTVKALLNVPLPNDTPTAEGKTPMELAPSGAMKEVLRKFGKPKEEL